jgi:predicted GNAT superfamily acetyltransferase
VSDAVLAEAGLTIQPLDSLTRVCAAEDLLAHIWQTTGTPPLTADVMRAVEHAGGYVVGVYADTRLVGASAGFLAMGADGRVRLHSHISGLLREVQGRQVGWALKQHQRDWALQRGIDCITWTFDPLLRRNAWFNLAKLGATGVEYLVDFYGEMHDSVNAGEPSDRVFCHWDLRSPAAVTAAGGRSVVLPAATCPLVLDERDGWPSRAQEGAPAGPVRLRLPADVERLRNQQPEAARAWRAAVRQLLGPLLDAGRRTDGMTADAELVVGAAPASGAAPDSGPAG